LKRALRLSARTVSTGASGVWIENGALAYPVEEVTIATGILQIFVNPHNRELLALSSRWAIAIIAGAVMALIAYGILRGAAKPAIERLLAVAPTAAGGDAAAAAEVGRMRERIQRLGYAQLTLGALILVAMVTARFS